MIKVAWRLGCLNAAISVAMAAAGGHKPWEIDKKLVYEKGFNLHLTSSIGMCLASLKKRPFPALFFLNGTIFFSGVIYYRCFYDDKSYNKLMPIGGTSIILGWILLAI